MNQPNTHTWGNWRSLIHSAHQNHDALQALIPEALALLDAMSQAEALQAYRYALDVIGLPWKPNELHDYIHGEVVPNQRIAHMHLGQSYEEISPKLLSPTEPEQRHNLFVIFDGPFELFFSTPSNTLNQVLVNAPAHVCYTNKSLTLMNTIDHRHAIEHNHHDDVWTFPKVKGLCFGFNKQDTSAQSVTWIAVYAPDD